MKSTFGYLSGIALMAVLASCSGGDKIDREALVSRNNPHITELNPLNSLNLGNGRFTVTLDATGLQSFPEYCKDGLSLGTYTEWTWHNFPNVEGYTMDEMLEEHPLPGHPKGLYAVQKGYAMDERGQAAADWFRSNPQRLHLGNFGFAGMLPEEVSDVDQTLDMWNGELVSNFRWNAMPVSVRTASDGELDLVAAKVKADQPLPIVLRFPYPTGVHTDHASDWNSEDKHLSEIVESTSGSVLIRRTVDDAVYYCRLSWKGGAALSQSTAHTFILSPEAGEFEFSVSFADAADAAVSQSYAKTAASARKMWGDYWKNGGVIDFSHCTDSRAALLERRVLLSQYLMRVQEAQSCPPSETGMTYNSWFGKFHLEMVMWHSFHYATWGHADLLAQQLDWYVKVMPEARKIAERQGFPGVRWMKMTDPTGTETSSDVGSFIIWQQPHPIYMAELIYRANPSREIVDRYFDVVQQTAEFVAAFASYDEENDRYIIEGACAANESLDEDHTVNPAFELAYWHFALTTAQLWRERKGLERDAKWDEIRDKLAPLAYSPEGIYMAAEKGPGVPDFKTMTIKHDVYEPAPPGGYVNGQRIFLRTETITPDDIKPGQRNPFRINGTSSENLLAYGVLPESRLIEIDKMQSTLTRAAENYGWNGSWSWQFPTLAMNATRLYNTEVALRAITMDNRDDLLLPSGNNYRSETLRMYLPGNGGLLFAVGMMCAGWDGCEEPNPGFPKDGTWDVRWEGLTPLP